MDDDLDPDWGSVPSCIRVRAQPAPLGLHRIPHLHLHAIARQVLAMLVRESPKLDVAAHTLGLYVALGNLLLSPRLARSHALASELTETGGRLAALLQPGRFFATPEAEQYPAPVLGLDIDLDFGSAARDHDEHELLLPFVLVGWTDVLAHARLVWRRTESPPGSALFMLLAAELDRLRVEAVRGSDRLAA